MINTLFNEIGRYIWHFVFSILAISSILFGPIVLAISLDNFSYNLWTHSEKIIISLFILFCSLVLGYFLYKKYGLNKNTFITFLGAFFVSYIFIFGFLIVLHTLAFNADITKNNTADNITYLGIPLTFLGAVIRSYQVLKLKDSKKEMFKSNQ